MKRAEPHYPTNDDENPTPTPQNLNLNPMNLISDPVRCPFCVKPDFGVVYNLPIWLPQERRLDIPPREIARRRKNLKQRQPVKTRGVLAKYADHVSQAHLGAITDGSLGT